MSNHRKLNKTNSILFIKWVNVHISTHFYIFPKILWINLFHKPLDRTGQQWLPKLVWVDRVLVLKCAKNPFINENYLKKIFEWAIFDSIIKWKTCNYISRSHHKLQFSFDQILCAENVQWIKWWYISLLSGKTNEIRMKKPNGNQTKTGRKFIP